MKIHEDIIISINEETQKAMIVNIAKEDGNMLELSGLAFDYIKLIESDITLDQETIITNLIRMYDSNDDEIKKELDKIIAQLIEHKVLVEKTK